MQRVSWGNAQVVLFAVVSFLGHLRADYVEAGTAASPTNYWLGAEAAYNVAGSGRFADDFQPSAETKLQLWKPAFAESLIIKERLYLPIRGNIARLNPSATEDVIKQQLQNLITSSEGLSVSFAPTYQLAGKTNSYGLTTWASAGYRLNAYEDSSKVVQYLHQGQFSLGLEGSIGEFDSGNPATFGVEVFLATFSAEKYEAVFGTSKESFLSMELTAVLPVYDDMGLQFQNAFANNNAHPVWRIGLLIKPKK